MGYSSLAGAKEELEFLIRVSACSSFDAQRTLLVVFVFETYTKILHFELQYGNVYLCMTCSNITEL